MTTTEDVIRLALDTDCTYINLNSGDMDASLERLRHLISLAKAEALAEGWEPIETAPEVGEFLVFMPDEPMKIQAASFRTNVKVIGSAFAFDLTKPTHWRPLPPPPSMKEAT